MELGPPLSTSTSRCPPLSLSRRALLFIFTPAFCMYSNPSDGLSWLITQYSHPSITISRAQHDESTSNLACHVCNCAPADSTQTCALVVYASRSKYTKASHRLKIALWVSNHHRLFSIVEDPELLEIFTDLNPNCDTPKHHTVSHDVKEIFFLSQTGVGTTLQVGCVTLHCSTICYHIHWSDCSLGPEQPDQINYP